MSTIHDYLQANAVCVDRSHADPAAADVVFFKVLKKDSAEAAQLVMLIRQHSGEYGDLDLFDGEEHNYLDVGGWLGSQQDALALIGLGTSLGLWQLLSPKTVLGPDIDEDTERLLAGRGLVSLRARAAATA
jgi:hypothetical protein